MTSLGTLIYSGPLSRTVCILKRFSVSSLGISLATSPIILLTPIGNLTFGIKCGMLATVLATSLASTALINWGINPYVCKIYLAPAPVHNGASTKVNSSSDSVTPNQRESKLNATETSFVTLETYTILGRPFHTRIPVSMLRSTLERPFANWTIGGSTLKDEFYPRKPFMFKKRKWFYVQQDIPDSTQLFKDLTGKVATSS